MYIEILTEDRSTRVLLQKFLPTLLQDRHHIRCDVYPFRKDPDRNRRSGSGSGRGLLGPLESHLRSYPYRPNTRAVVVVCDLDKQDRAQFLAELQELARACGAGDKTRFVLAIEETEAWLLGDPEAIGLAGLQIRNHEALTSYVPDSICDTWEVLADVLYKGGHGALRKAGGPAKGQAKCEWAERIGPHLNPERNRSPSFRKFCAAMRGILETGSVAPPASGR